MLDPGDNLATIGCVLLVGQQAFAVQVSRPAQGHRRVIRGNLWLLRGRRAASRLNLSASLWAPRPPYCRPGALVVAAVREEDEGSGQGLGGQSGHPRGQGA